MTELVMLEGLCWADEADLAALTLDGAAQLARLDRSKGINDAVAAAMPSVRPLDLALPADVGVWTYPATLQRAAEAAVWAYLGRVKLSPSDIGLTLDEWGNREGWLGRVTVLMRAADIARETRGMIDCGSVGCCGIRRIGIVVFAPGNGKEVKEWRSMR